jgi:hypothetical protein
LVLFFKKEHRLLSEKEAEPFPLAFRFGSVPRVTIEIGAA